MMNLIIAYGENNVSLNKGNENLVLTNEEIAFIVQSALKNLQLNISIKNN